MVPAPSQSISLLEGCLRQAQRLTSRHLLPLKTLMSATTADPGLGCTSKSLLHSASDVAPSVRSMVCRRGLQLRELRSRMWSRTLQQASQVLFPVHVWCLPGVLGLEVKAE